VPGSAVIQAGDQSPGHSSLDFAILPGRVTWLSPVTSDRPKSRHTWHVSPTCQPLPTCHLPCQPGRQRSPARHPTRCHLSSYSPEVPDTPPRCVLLPCRQLTARVLSPQGQDGDAAEEPQDTQEAAPQLPAPDHAPGPGVPLAPHCNAIPAGPPPLAAAGAGDLDPPEEPPVPVVSPTLADRPDSHGVALTRLLPLCAWLAWWQVHESVGVAEVVGLGLVTELETTSVDSRQRVQDALKREGE
jgi:hypothetical protein